MLQHRQDKELSTYCTTGNETGDDSKASCHATGILNRPESMLSTAGQDGRHTSTSLLSQEKVKEQHREEKAEDWPFI